MTYQPFETLALHSDEPSESLDQKERDQERLDFERYVQLSNRLHDLQQLANSGFERAVRELQSEGLAIQAELDRITAKYSAQIANDTQSTDFS